MSDLQQQLNRISSEKRSYVLQHLPEHHVHLRQYDRLCALLTDIFFLEAKTKEVSVFDLVADFTRATEAIQDGHRYHKILLLLEEAIRRDIHFISRNAKDYPQGLFQCLWNSCWWYDCSEAELHYDPPDKGWSQGEPAWKQQGEQLHILMETWRRTKALVTPSVRWIRSLLPPSPPLGTAQRMVLRGHESLVQTAVFFSGNRRIISGSRDKTVRIWDVKTGKELHCFVGHNGEVYSVSFSPDNKRIVSGSSDRTVRVWDADSGTLNCGTKIRLFERI